MKTRQSISLIAAFIFLSGCTPRSELPIYIEEVQSYPTPASTLPELIIDVSDDDPLVRIVSMRALERFGDDAVAALPALVENLYYPNEQLSAVRLEAAYAIARLGPSAKDAVPDLLVALQSDRDTDVRETSVYALGEIGDPSAVPGLAAALFEENARSLNLSITSAEVISSLTGVWFPDVGGGGYRLDEDGNPLIVIAARRWWKEEGQYQDWNNR